MKVVNGEAVRGASESFDIYIHLIYYLILNWF